MTMSRGVSSPTKIWSIFSSQESKMRQKGREQSQTFQRKKNEIKCMLRSNWHTLVPSRVSWRERERGDHTISTIIICHLAFFPPPFFATVLIILCFLKYDLESELINHFLKIKKSKRISSKHLTWRTSSKNDNFNIYSIMLEDISNTLTSPHFID